MEAIASRLVEAIAIATSSKKPDPDSLNPQRGRSPKFKPPAVSEGPVGHREPRFGPVGRLDPIWCPFQANALILRHFEGMGTVLGLFAWNLTSASVWIFVPETAGEDDTL